MAGGYDVYKYNACYNSTMQSGQQSSFFSNTLCPLAQVRHGGGRKLFKLYCRTFFDMALSLFTEVVAVKMTAVAQGYHLAHVFLVIVGSG